MNIEEKLKEYDEVVKEIDAELKALGDKCREEKSWGYYVEEETLLLSKYDDALKEMFGLGLFYQEPGEKFDRMIMVEDKTPEELEALEKFQKMIAAEYGWWNPMGEWLEYAHFKFRNVEEALEHLDYERTERQEKSEKLLAEKGTLVKRQKSFGIRNPNRDKWVELNRGSRYE